MTDVDRVIEHCQKVLRERDELRAANERLAKAEGAFLAEIKRLVADRQQAQELYMAMLAEMNVLRAGLTEISDLELEGDASLDDAIRVADETLNPPP